MEGAHSSLEGGDARFQLEKEENVGYGRRLSRVKTSIRNGRNPLTSGRGNSLYRCGERRSSRAAGIRGSLKKRLRERSYRKRVAYRKEK